MSVTSRPLVLQVISGAPFEEIVVNHLRSAYIIGKTYGKGKPHAASEDAEDSEEDDLIIQEEDEEDDELEEVAGSRSSSLVAVCNSCHIFLASYSKQQKKRERLQHPMHMVVNYILSGACTRPMPCRPQLRRCLIMLLTDPPNPILLHTLNGVWHERLLASKLIVESLGDNNEDGVSDDILSLVRWLFEGAQQVMADADLARNMRRLLSQIHCSGTTTTTTTTTTTSRLPSPAMMQMWMTLPDSCRHCVLSKSQAALDSEDAHSGCCYSAAMLFKGSRDFMECELQRIEASSSVVPGVTLLCPRCCQVSAISFEFAKALRRSFLDLSIRSSAPRAPRPPHALLLHDTYHLFSSVTLMSQAQYYAHLVALHGKLGQKC